MPPHSHYWNVDGKYAAVALGGVFAFGFLWAATRKTVPRAALFAARLLFGVVCAYELALIVFDRPALFIHATNFQKTISWLSWVTNFDVLIISSIAFVLFLMVGVVFARSPGAQIQQAPLLDKI